MENNPLNNYHTLFLTKTEVKAIFRLGSDRSLRDLKKEYGLRKRGRHYLTVDVKRAIEEMQSEAQAA